MTRTKNSMRSEADGFKEQLSNSACWRRKHVPSYEFKHIIFGVMGGFYFSPYFEHWMKRWWIRFNLLCCIISIGTCVGYLGTMKDSDFGTIVYAIFIIDVCATSVLFIPWVTYYFKSELELMLRLNENKLPSKRTAARKLMKTTKIFFGMKIGWFGGIVLIHILMPLVSSNDEYLNDEKYYYAPNPAIPYIHSELQYITITIFSALFNLPAFVIGFSPSVFVLLIAHEFYLQFAALCGRIQKFSRHATKSFESLKEGFLDISDSECSSFDQYQHLTEEDRRYLEKNMTTAIREFQDLRKKLNVMKTYVQFQFSLLMIIGIIATLLIISSFYSTNMNDIQKIKGFMLLNIAIVWWMCYCYAGKIFTEIGEMMAEQVFEIPWLYLDSPCRKTFYMFLFLAQRPIHFHGNKIFVMGMPLFLQISKLLYSYSNFLRTMQTK